MRRTKAVAVVAVIASLSLVTAACGTKNNKTSTTPSAEATQSSYKQGGTVTIANEQGQMDESARWLERAAALADPAEEWAGRIWLLHMEAVLAMHARETEKACGLFDRLQALATNG